MNIHTDIEETARGWFVRLNGPDASEAEWLAFQDWIEAEPAHRDAYDRVEALWIALDEVPRSALPANDDLPRPRRSRPGWLYPAVGMAAALALAVGVWPLFDAPTEIYRTESAPRTVELSDGSVIHMNRHSDLSVRMERGRREVVLSDGEAAFDVAHNASRPFVITASDHSVQVLGTAFNVVNHDGRFSVSVERGVVAVTPASGKEAMRLTAGQRVDQLGRQPAVLSRVDPASASTWRSGVLVYRNASLAEVGDDLSRYLDKPVNLSVSAQNLRFTGVLRVADEAVMLEQLKELAPVEVVRSADGVDLTGRDSR
ncbi:FecR domain-containing protein [Brevundimonas sp.]|jgi:transmembrane sensor|uniref:FecR family protein n=1 Tax=Brevundimonas sp. TaxID=1871086 RepID=UPI0025B8E834|nr:FecR domain-containing protein [Brevundimonas sp.]